MFVRLCEDHLPVKPSVVRHSCRRLGKPSADRPRKLLIRLHSESAAQSLLKAARELRTCDNASVAANVYINSDLSPAEAKIAFEKRQRKRERAHGSNQRGSRDKQHLNLDVDCSGSQHQHLGSTHCDAEGSTESTVNRSSTPCKDITGLTNDDVVGVTMDSHNVEASINSMPQASSTLSSTTPAGTHADQSFRNV